MPSKFDLLQAHIVTIRTRY